MTEAVRGTLAALVALLVVVAAHFLVDPWSRTMDDPVKAYRWIQYILRGPEFVVFAVIALAASWRWPEPAWSLLLFAGTLGIVEETKMSVCGIAMFGSDPSSLHLCTRAFGFWPNLIGAATALTFWIIVARLREKEDPIL